MQCYGCFNEKPDGVNVCPYCGYHSDLSEELYPSALKEGTLLAGRYVIGRVLGQGGFCITYIANEYRKNRLVAIKEYFPDTLAWRAAGNTVSSYTDERSESFQYGLKCFLDEADTLSRFSYVRNICSIFSYFEENGTAYFAMEYIAGESLQNLLKRRGGRIPYAEAQKILFPVMDALEAVHEKGIIHRDISPDNILIRNDGEVKLLDFGAARYSLGDKSRSLDVILKHGYAPKEQYTRHGRQGPFTDVYSLAATFYKSLTGKTPPDSIDRLEEDRIVLPSVLGSDIPDSAEKALMKALSVNPQDRYATMAEFKKAMSGNAFAGFKEPAGYRAPYAAAGYSSPVYPASVQPAPPAPTAQSAPVTQAASKKKGSKKAKIIISLLCALALAGAAVALTVILMNKDSDKKEESSVNVVMRDTEPSAEPEEEPTVMPTEEPTEKPTEAPTEPEPTEFTFSNTSPAASYFEKAVNFTIKNTDLEHYQVSGESQDDFIVWDDDTNKITKFSYVWNATNPELFDKGKTVKLQDGATVEIGKTTIQELLDRGYHFEGEEQADTIPANQAIKNYVLMKNNKSISVIVGNHTNKPVQVGTCIIEALFLYGPGSNVSEYSVFLSNFDYFGINLQTPYAEVMSTLGEPTIIRVDTVYDDPTNSTIEYVYILSADKYAVVCYRYNFATGNTSLDYLSLLYYASMN